MFSRDSKPRFRGPRPEVNTGLWLLAAVAGMIAAVLLAVTGRFGHLPAVVEATAGRGSQLRAGALKAAGDVLLHGLGGRPPRAAAEHAAQHVLDELLRDCLAAPLPVGQHLVGQFLVAPPQLPPNVTCQKHDVSLTTTQRR